MNKRSLLQRMARAEWGAIQSQHTLAPGVLAVSTAGHGGIVVDADVYPLSQTLRDYRGSGGGFKCVLQYVEGPTRLFAFEEDCAVEALWLYHPDLLTAAQRKHYIAGYSPEDFTRLVRESVERWFPDLLEGAVAC